MVVAHRQLLKSKLKREELLFITANMNKHRLVQWINLFAGICIFFSLHTVPLDQLGTVISALIAPVMVMGTAWFAISFGAIPAHLIACSLEVTFWMYCAFKMSFTTMFLAIGFITPVTLWPVLAFIYVAVDFSCAQYDSADGLKAGLDEALLKHSRAALIFYEREGIDLLNSSDPKIK